LFGGTIGVATFVEDNTSDEFKRQLKRQFYLEDAENEARVRTPLAQGGSYLGVHQRLSRASLGNPKYREVRCTLLLL